MNASLTVAPREDAPHAGQGRIKLAFAFDGVRTVLARQFCQAPLQVQRALFGTCTSAEVALLNVAGGVLGGDELDVVITAGPRTHVSIGTIGATRLYRAAGDVPALSRVTLHVADGAYLEYTPDEIIPYAGALYEQTIALHLAVDARAVATEVIGPGRLHRGEVFAYRRLAFRLRIEREGRPLLRERLVLDPQLCPPESGALLGRFTHLGSLYAVGPRADASLAHALHLLLAERGVYGSATLGHGDTVMLRAVGHSAYALAQALRAAVVICRQCLMEDRQMPSAVSSRNL